MTGQQVLREGNFSQNVAVVPPVANMFNAALNSSSKLFTVPGNELWKICSAHVILVTDATVGNRQMAFEVLDAAGQLITNLSAGATQAATLTNHYSWMQGIYREAAFTANEIECPMNIDMYVPPGGSIRFYDQAAIAVATDDMTVSFQYLKYTI